MKLSPLSILTALAILGLIVLAALGAHSPTLDQLALVLGAAAAGNEFPRLASVVDPAPAPASSSTPAPAPAYPVSNP